MSIIFDLTKNNSKAPSGIAFEKSDSADLFNALHNTDASTKVNFAGTALATYNVTITDTYDFALDTNYQSLFTSLVNNAAWLYQHTDNLNVMNVKREDIAINYRFGFFHYFFCSFRFWIYITKLTFLINLLNCIVIVLQE